MAQVPDQIASLEPARAELLRAARADAQTSLAQAEQEAATLLDGARAEARTILEEARRRGVLDGEAVSRGTRARARRAARARQLAASAEVYTELRRRSTERARDLRNSAEYSVILDRLSRRARRLLGPDADVTEHPDGGVVAHVAGRRVDLTLDALVARALDRFGAEARTLWSP